MDVSATYITCALNDGLGRNFSETVNRLRVAAVQARLADPAEARDVLELALDAGFSSKASFNRNFKMYTGQTPSRVRERALHGPVAAEAVNEAGSR